MSWLGGSISSLTGQLSDFTKDILTEGTEEVSDHATELRFAQGKIQELEALCVTHQSENERLSKVSRELEEKAESSELQINSISREYRSLLLEKEKEINRLKQKQHELLELQIKPVVSQVDSTLTHSTSTGSLSSSIVRDSGFDASSYQSEDLDFGENISLQYEVNQLRRDVQRFQSESQHWRGLAEQLSKDESDPDKQRADLAAVQTEVKELKQRLSNEKEKHQHELATLQDVHAQKLSALKKKHKHEIGELKQKIDELQNTSATDGEKDNEACFEEKQQVCEEEKKAEEELAVLQKTLTDCRSELDAVRAEREKLNDKLLSQSNSDKDVAKLTEALHKAEEELKQVQDEKEQVRVDLYATKQRLLDQLDANHAQSLELICDLQAVRRQMDSAAVARRDHMLDERQRLVNLMIETGQKKNELESCVCDLEETKEHVLSETGKMVKDLGNEGHQHLTKEILNMIEKENLVLKEQNLSFQEQITLLERTIHTLTEEQHEREERVRSLMKQVKSLGGSLDLASGDSFELNSEDGSIQVENADFPQELLKDDNFSELSERNKWLDKQVHHLQLQVKKHKQDIEQFEYMKSDWLLEKEALEDVLMSLREQLKEKEMMLNVIQAQRGLEEVERQERKDERGELCQTNGKSDLVDKANLFTFEESLSAEAPSLGSEESSDIGADIEKLDQQVELLTQANADLENERDSLLIEKNTVKAELATVKARNSELENSALEKGRCKIGPGEQERREAEGAALLANLTMEKAELEASLEELDGQHQEAMAELIKMRDNLAKKNCELVQGTEDQEWRIAELLQEKNDAEENAEKLNLRIKELTDAVNSLMNELSTSRTEKERVVDEMKEMKKKMEKCAIAINDLHMDKQELEELLARNKKETEEKSKRISEFRLENEHLVEACDNLQKNASVSSGWQLQKQDLLKTIKNLQDRLSKSSQLNEDKQTEIDELQQEYDDLSSVKEEKNEALLTQIKMLTSEKSSLEVKLNETRLKQLSLVNNKEQEVVKMKEKLVQEALEKDEQLMDLRLQIELLTSERERQELFLTAETATLQAKLNETGLKHQSSVNDYEEEAKKMREKHEKLVQEILEQETLVSEMRLEMDSLKDGREKGEIERLQTILEENESKHLSTINHHKQEAIRMEEQQKALVQDVFRKEELLSELRVQLEALKTEQENRMLMVSSEEAVLLKEKDELVLENLEKGKQLSELQGLVETLKTEQDNALVASAKLNEVEVKYQLSVSNYEQDITAMQKEQKILKQEIQGKDEQVAELQAQAEMLKTDLSDSKELLQSSLESLERMSSMLRDKDSDINEIKQQNSELTHMINEHTSTIRQQEEMINNSKDLASQIQTLTQENRKLAEERDSLRTSQNEISNRAESRSKTLDLITDLESELSDASKKIKQLEEENIHLRNTVLESKSGSGDQNVEIPQEKDAVKIIDLSKDGENQKEINQLVEKLQHIISITDVEKLKSIDDELVDVVSQLNLKSKRKQLQFCKEIGFREEKQDECERTIFLTGVEEECAELLQDGSKESLKNHENKLEELQEIIQVKDSIIHELQNNNAVLLKMIESKSLSLHGDKSLLDIHKIETELKSLKLEKEQMLAVMNEKSREASSLRSEVHKLMSFVSAQKSALDNLQRDNEHLRERQCVNENDMQKEAVQKLSNIIRDKDLEIEALKQKNDTLLAVFQDNSENGAKINTLVQDKENLKKQIIILQSERDQIVSYLNQKHQESLTYHSEVQRLSAYIQEENAKHKKLQEDFMNLVPQFEDRKQALLKSQNELINHKQRYSELEAKYGELLQKTNVSETIDLVSYNLKVEELNSLQKKYANLQAHHKEKDQKVHNLSQRAIELEHGISKKELEQGNLRKQVENLSFQIQGLQMEINESKTEMMSSQKHVSEQGFENAMLKETNNSLMLSLQSKDYEVRSLQEKANTLVAMLKEKEGEKGQIDQLINESEAVRQQAKQFQQERDQTILALKQIQLERETLHVEFQDLKGKEIRLNKELQRLRNHLLQIEESYTKEALEAEEREKDLRNKLAAAEEKLLFSQTAVESASQEANHQVDSLQQQLHMLASQRSEAYVQLATSQEQCQQYAAALANLQMVLEQFQQDREAQMVGESEKHEQEQKLLKDKNNQLQLDLEETKLKLFEASDGLQAAQRLSEQLDNKEELVLHLRTEAQQREMALMAAEEHIRHLSSSSETQVDKLVMKNLLLGYFTATQNKKHDVLKLIGGILQFNQEEFQKAEGIRQGGSWFPGFLRFGSSSPHKGHPSVYQQAAASQLDKSFSELFVKFLERESTPPPPVVRMPAEAMARELQLKQKMKETHPSTPFNPFTAPRHVAIPISADNSSVSHHLLMASLTPPVSVLTPVSTATVDPMPVTSTAILRDVLGASKS